MKKKNLLLLENPKSHFAEAFRVLRTNIDFFSPDHQLKTLLITSPGPGEGKSTTAANLALVMAQINKKIALIDTDLRWPSLHKVFGIKNETGLTNVLAGRASVESAIRKIYGINLITAGPLPPNPSELLSSQRMEEIWKNLKQTYDLIIVDSPPVNLVSDAAIVAGKVDGTVLVIESGQTRIDCAREAKEQLQKVRANIIGVILNKVSSKGSRYYYHGYYYSHE